MHMVLTCAGLDACRSLLIHEVAGLAHGDLNSHLQLQHVTVAGGARGMSRWDTALVHPDCAATLSNCALFMPDSCVYWVMTAAEENDPVLSMHLPPPITQSAAADT